MKAKYIREHYGTGYDRNKVFIEYEYKGFRYEVMKDLAKGNEPISWQHRSEQDRIDRIIDSKERKTGGPTAAEAFDLFFNYLETEVWK